MACICCPDCDHIYKAPDSGPHPCPLCGWDGKWKQEKEEEPSREIIHPALRGIH